MLKNMVLKGLDLSHWNKIINYNEIGSDFVILKTTEGTKFIDPLYKRNVKEFRKRGKLIGHYHFLDDINNWEKEAKHFLNTVDYKKGDILALDYERAYLAPVKNCYNWLKKVEKELGTKPLIYLNVSLVNNHDWSKIINNGNKLWIADYYLRDPKTGKFKDCFSPRIGKWKSYYIHQYASDGKVNGIKGKVDLNNLNKKNMEKTSQEKVLGWLREHVYNFGNKINEKESKEIIKRLSAYKNASQNDDKVKYLQSSLKRYKDTLNTCLGKAIRFQKMIDAQEKIIKDLKNVNTKNAKDARIGEAFIFLLNVIKNKI